VKIELKSVRESRGLSQNGLARITGMSPQNIQKLEQGRSTGFQLDTLECLCDALNCAVGDLIVRTVPANCLAESPSTYTTKNG